MNSETLMTDETVVYEGKLHWGIFVIPGIIDFLMIGAIVGLLVIRHPWPAALLFVFSLICLLPVFLRYSSNGLVLTNKRVIVKTGVTSRRSIDIALSKIEGVSIEQTLLGQMFNFGTVIVRGTGGGIEKFPQLGAPAEFTKQVHQQMAPKTT